MIDLPSRELRNDVSAVLRRVEGGESVRITVSGRPVAQLVPLSRRGTAIPTATLLSALDKGAADRQLADELANVLLDTTDDLFPE